MSRTPTAVNVRLGLVALSTPVGLHGGYLARASADRVSTPAK
jgi:hypothetical protein